MHRCRFTVYYEDTDAGGVVYYANYLKFAERARTEWLRELGFDQSALWQDARTGFAVRRCAMELYRPARLDDALTVETALQELRRASLVMAQHIRREETLLADIEVTLACVNQDFTPIRLPHDLREKLYN